MSCSPFVSRIATSKTVGLVAKVCGVATTFCAIVFDVLAHVAPLALYAGLALLAALPVIVLATISSRINGLAGRIFGDYWPTPIILTTIISCVMLLSSYGLTKRATSGSEARGFLSENFKIVRAIQKDLGIVEETVAEIARHTEAISTKMDNVKKETSDDPRKEIANLGIPWSTDSYVSSLIAGDLPMIDLFIRGGMDATTRHKGSSALLYALQPELGNQPVEVLKVFVSHGFDLDTHLVDQRILNSWSDRMLPSMFETDLAPEGYTGGYAGGKFVGPVMLWVVSLGAYRGFTDDQMAVVRFLLENGAEARTTLSYLRYSERWMGDTRPFKRILPIIAGSQPGR